MKKYVFIRLIILLIIVLLGFRSRKALLRKMDIKDIPIITDVEYVSKRTNFVSNTRMYLGDMESFENYAKEVYEYLNLKYLDTLGFTTEQLESFFGTSSTYDYYNKTRSINEFRNETDEKITYQFIYSKNNSFWLNENENTYYLKEASSVYLVYFKDFQEKEDEKNKYNIAVEFYKPRNQKTYAHVNSDVFSKYIFPKTRNLRAKEYLLNLFFEEYKLNELSKHELTSLLGVGYGNYPNLEYRYGDSDNDNIYDKKLVIYYDDEKYIKHEIIINSNS